MYVYKRFSASVSVSVSVSLKGISDLSLSSVINLCSVQYSSENLPLPYLLRQFVLNYINSVFAACVLV